jgi:hypothetical protein
LPLQKPSSEDVRKIHAEINQLLNQRFLLTTAGITVFGVMTAWLLPKSPPQAGDPVGSFIFTVALILSVLLFTLYLLSHFLRGVQRVCSTYLIETNMSGWEHDWEQYRREPYWAYSKPQTILFLLLNVLSTGFPFILAAVYAQQAGLVLAQKGGGGEGRRTDRSPRTAGPG